MIAVPVMIAALAMATETQLLVRPGGVTELAEAKIRFTPTVYYPGWTAREAKGGWRPEADGSRRWQIPARDYNDTAHPLANGRTGWTADADGSVGLDYCLEPLRTERILCAAVVGALPNDEYAGGSLVADAKTIAVPTDVGKPFVFRGKVKTVSISDRKGNCRLTLEFPQETDVMLQDNRTWRGKTFSLRIYLQSGEVEVAEGQKLTLSFRIRAPKPIRCETKSFRIEQGKDWLPVDGTFTVEPGSALDFTDIGGTGRPAGKYGYPVVRDGHFEFENLPGKPQRFYGVNFVGAANNPDVALAKPFAENLARLGYNAVRMHHHDQGITGGKDGVLDAAVMERFDAFVAALIENGLYVTTDFYVSRKPKYRDCGIDRDGRFEKIDVYKRVAMFHEGTFQNFIRCSRAFLAHVNPHTGRRYADEPALGWISYVNEGTLGSAGFDWIETCRDDVLAKWKSWLAAKRQADKAYAAIPVTIPSRPKDMTTGRNHRNAFLLFLADVERAFDRRVTRFVREEMKCRALVTNMNYGFKPPSYQKLIVDELDYMDDHFYVDHPHFLERSWKLPSELENGNTFQRTTEGAMCPVTRRIFGKPFVITEYNYSGPGRYRCVGGIATGAMAALQDWDGLWRFAWSHGDRGIREAKPMTYFDMSGDPLSLASERASMCLFLRRDVEPFTTAAAYQVERATADSLSTVQLNVPTAWRPAAWWTKVGCFVGDAVPASFMTVGSSRDGRAELAKMPERPEGLCSPIAVDPSAGSFTISTFRTAGGFAESGTISAAGLSAVVDTPATVWASSLDGKPLAESSRILVTHLTDVQNSGITYADSSRRILLDWGDLPHLMRNGSAEISIGLRPGDWTVHSLAPTGRRTGTVDSCRRGERLVFTSRIDRNPASATYLYEVVRQ